MLWRVLATIALAGGGLCAYLYFRPPRIPPISEKPLRHLLQLKARQGDTEEQL